MVLDGVKHRRETFSPTLSGAYVSNQQFGVRSARKAFAFIQGANISDNSGQSTCSANNSLSTFLRFEADRYQFKVGSEEFPYEEIEITDYPHELLQQLLRTTNQYDRVEPVFRFKPSALYPQTQLVVDNAGNANDLNVNNQAVKVIMSARLERHDMPFTEADLSINPLDLEIDFATPADGNINTSLGNRVLNVFVHYDEIVSISSAGIIVRN